MEHLHLRNLFSGHATVLTDNTVQTWVHLVLYRLNAIHSINQGIGRSIRFSITNPELTVQKLAMAVDPPQHVFQSAEFSSS